MQDLWNQGKAKEKEIIVILNKISIGYDNDFIIGKCKRQLRSKAGGSLPFGSQSFKITEREPYYGD